MKSSTSRIVLACLTLLAWGGVARPSIAQERPSPSEPLAADEEIVSEDKSAVKVESPAKGPSEVAAVKADIGRPEVTNVAPSHHPLPFELPSGAAKTGVSSQAISLPQGAGKLGGMGESFSTNLSTGGGSFSIPISMPSARGAAQPSLALSYSSASGYGVAGVGWDLGVPFIARQTDRGLPNYQDGVGWSPQQDRFVFNGGQELVPICVVAADDTCSGALADEVMPSWASGWLYFRPRVEGSFVRVFWSPDHLTWRVQSKLGTTLELGVAPGSTDRSAIEADPADATHIFRWNMARQYDVEVDGQGRPVNLVVYRYLSSGGLAYLSDIYDTPPVSGAATASLSTYAHHTRILYETRKDPVTSFRRGYRTDQLLRVQGIDVTSMPFDPGSGDVPELVRRYHLAYDTAFHASQLVGVTVEGRCVTPISEGENGNLPSTTPCPTLPPTVLGYQHVAGFTIGGQPSPTPDLPGYEAFDERVRHMASSPSYSLDGKYADLFDINSDGLPDVVVTLPGFFQGKHGLFLNGGNGGDSFAASTISVTGVLGATATDITLENANVTPHDLDGDGVIDLLHMPLVKTYAVYTPKVVGGAWTWLGRTITTAAAQDPHIDFANNNANIKVMDVNGDGLVDIVYSAGTEMQTFLSLGRYEGGDGQYGHMVWAGASPPAISNDPLTTCVPWDATPVTLSDPDVTLADMNGDGLPDIVRVRSGQIEYWPGRGNGMWGTGSLADCAAGTFGQGQGISMASSPFYSQLVGLPYLDDVNGDGLADLVQVRFDGVDIWLNVDGVGWTASSHTIQGTPPVSSIANHVRIADMNGSGTRDIVWGDAGDYKYVDLLGGAVPAVLTHVENGLGKTTDIAYTSSTALMLADAQQPGKAWTSTAPMPINVVSSITERDHLAAFGHPEGVYVTEYKYRNAVYEGRQREFRGFRTAGTRTIGDANSPTSISRSTFLLGECLDESSGNACSPNNLWQDNPREALKGLPVLSETFDESGSSPSTPGYNFLDATGLYASSAHTTIRLRRLYVGLDGREVRTSFTSRSDTYLYDLAVTPSAGSPRQQVDVELELTLGTLSQDPAPSTVLVPRSTAGMAHTASSSTVDPFGNATATVAYGCVEGCPTVDETITTATVPELPFGDLSGWLWRTVETYTSGSSSPSARLHDTYLAYDTLGHLSQTSAVLSGTLPLDRFHQDPAKSVAPPPPGASADGTILLGSVTQRDPFGNVLFQTGAGGRCSAEHYDPTYAEFAVVETIYAGAVVSGTPSCGGVSLTTSAVYDRGLGVITSMTDLHGEVSLVGYDGFGRLTSLTKPDPSLVGSPSPLPSVTVEYLLTPDPTHPVYSLVHTRTQDGADPSVSSYRDTYAFVDGMGRTILTLDQADPSAGDGAPWVASGAVQYDAKGAALHAYLPWFYAGTVDFEAISTAALPAYKRMRYDAFGHAVQSFNLDGSIAAAGVFHALSGDVWDAADLAPGPHYGTPATMRHDGHGRVVSAIERIGVQGTIEQHETRTTYRPSGEITSVTRQRLGFPDAPVVRWMQYDSLGRQVLNVDPNTTAGPMPALGTDPSTLHAWRYAYDDAGELVGTSDARGCGVNFYYDAAGRALAEDYSPCLSSHADYSVPDLATGVGVETAYLYDAPDPNSAALGPATPGLTIDGNLLLGRLVSVADRGAKVLFQYDGRGRTTGLGKRVARPGPAHDDPTLRYAPRWYVSTVLFDGADRPVLTSTGARAPELLGAGQASTVAVQYSKRGTVTTVGGSYGTLVAGMIRDANGLDRQISYGDAAQTTKTSLFDARLRLSTAQTIRAKAPIWSAPPAGYTPPSTSPSTLQLLLEDTSFTYDEVDNPVQIRDLRNPSEWPIGAKPVSRTMVYDDLYRLTRVDAQYAGGVDAWVPPFAAEDSGPVDPRLATPSPHVAFSQRMQFQSFAYDWLGNTTATDDDAKGFYDRSLGTITNGTVSSGPYQLQAAANAAGTSRSGALTAAYDPAGNLTSLAVQRNGPCLPAGASCSQRFGYDWDEVGRLVRARRWDQASAGVATDPVPIALPSADLAYAYDLGNQRMLKTATDVAGHQRHTVFVFGSLELRRAEWLPDPNDLTTGDYDDSAATEVPYLMAHGDRLARIVYDSGDPVVGGATTHVLLEMADHLGSTGTVIDKATGELVERTTYQAYGATESDYRPLRWDAFREDYRFTGKEEDAEVGLTYFGERYYAAALGRWTSPDPLAVHELGADLNLYAYVHGTVFQAVDPTGLQESPPATGTSPKDPASVPYNGPPLEVTVWGPPRVTLAPAPKLPLVVLAPPPPAPTEGGGNKYNPISDEGRVQKALLGSLPPSADPFDTPVTRALVKGVAGFIPGVNSALTFDDPHASNWEKGFAVGSDVLSVVGVGVIVKGVKAAAGAVKVAGAASKVATAAKEAKAVARAVKVAERIASKAPAELKCFGKCVEFADHLQSELVKKGIHGTRIDIDVGKNITIYSDSLRQGLGGPGGSHAVVRVGGKIFDNLRAGGIAASKFFEDIGGREVGRLIKHGFARVTKTPF